MVDILKKIYNGTLTTTSETKYTVPALTTTIVSFITLCNYSGSEVTATVVFDGTKILAESLEAGKSYFMELRSTLEAGDIITASATANSSIDMYISGIEVV